VPISRLDTGHNRGVEGVESPGLSRAALRLPAREGTVAAQDDVASPGQKGLAAAQTAAHINSIGGGTSIRADNVGYQVCRQKLQCQGVRNAKRSQAIQARLADDAIA
jgi:hypothetical protein